MVSVERAFFINPVWKEPLFISPGRKEPLFISPGRKEPLFISPGRKEPLFISPGRKEPLFISPGRKEPLFISPGRKEPLFISCCRKEPLFISPGLGRCSSVGECSEVKLVSIFYYQFLAVLRSRNRFFFWSEPGAGVGAAFLRRLQLHFLGKQKEKPCSCIKHDIKGSLEG